MSQLYLEMRWRGRGHVRTRVGMWQCCGQAWQMRRQGIDRAAGRDRRIAADWILRVLEDAVAESDDKAAKSGKSGPGPGARAARRSRDSPSSRCSSDSASPQARVACSGNSASG